MISGRGNNNNENGSGSASKQPKFHGVILNHTLWIFATLFVLYACSRAMGDNARDSDQVVALLGNSSIEVEVCNVTTILRQTTVQLLREGAAPLGPITNHAERGNAIHVIAEVQHYFSSFHTRYFSSFHTINTETRPMWSISNDFIATLEIIRAHPVMNIMQPLSL
jgi:hypothetical protein